MYVLGLIPAGCLDFNYVIFSDVLPASIAERPNCLSTVDAHSVTLFHSEVVYIHKTEPTLTELLLAVVNCRTAEIGAKVVEIILSR